MSTVTAVVGRERELVVLAALLERARDGRGGAALLVGEPGIGKTRTAREFATAARERGATVVSGRWYEGEGALAYGAWIEALESYAQALDDDQLARALGEAAPVLAHVVPKIRARLPKQRPPPALGAEEERFRFFEVTAGLLLGADQPLLLVLDDLHWADAGSLALLAYLGRRLDRSRLLVVCACRDELETGRPLADCLAELNRERVYTRIPLGGLSLEAVAELATELCGPLPDRVVEAIHAETGGNPFFVEEVVRHLFEEGRELAVRSDPGEWGVAPNVRHAIRRRLARLSVETNRVLAVAAVFTAAFDFPVLQALTGFAEDVLLDCLDEALAAKMIRPADGSESYEFQHTLVRHALYEELSPSRRARLHRRVASALAQVHAGCENEHAAELAFQYDASASLPGAAHGVPHALAAAEQARAACAPERVVTFLHMAQKLARDANPSLRADVLCRLALAEAEALAVDDSERSADEALGALEACGAPPERLDEFLASFTWSLQSAGATDEKVQSLVARGLRGLGSRRGLAWARLKLAERPIERIAAGPVNAGRWLGFDPEAVRIARANRDETDYARTLELMDWRTAAEVGDLLQLAESWREPGPKIHGLSVVVRSLAIQHGDMARTERVARRLLEVSESAGSVSGQAYALTYLAAALGLQGVFAAAVETEERARALIARLGPGHRLHASNVVLRKEPDELDPDWRAIGLLNRDLAVDATKPPWMGLVHAAYAVSAFALAEDALEAIQVLDWILPAIIASEPTRLNQNGAVAAAAEAIWMLGDASAALALRRTALELIEAGVGSFWGTSLELSVALTSALLDDLGRSREYFERARADVEARGLRPSRALVDFHEALALHRAGEAGAAPLVARARERFEKLGMSFWVRQADGLAARIHPGDALPDRLTVREAEVLRLLSGGRTNSEIAAELVLSVHTVERHLANVYRKIGARNRSEATAYALHAGLT